MIRCKNGGGAPHPTCFAVGQQPVQRRAIAAQYRRRDTGIRVALQTLYKAFDKPMWCQRRVALQVHHDVIATAQNRMGFGATLCPVGTVDRGHHHLGPEGFRGVLDAIIIGGHNNLVDALNLAGSTPAAFDQAACRTARPCQQRQRFRRIAGRGHSGRE